MPPGPPTGRSASGAEATRQRAERFEEQKEVARTALRDACEERERLLDSVIRVRAGCTYCQARNTPFQGLAADGAKIAVFDLVRGGYDVAAFVHDEVVIEIPGGTDEHYARAATDVERIMVSAMGQVCPDVKVKLEIVIAERWVKSGALWRSKQ